MKRERERQSERVETREREKDGALLTLLYVARIHSRKQKEEGLS